MCLAVPMSLTEVRDNGTGTCDMDGSRYEVDLGLIEDPKVGDYVIVHAGFAIEKLDEQEANERLELFDELAQVGWKPQAMK
ncbi:hypothetical protein BVX94_03275 [bacterium B17]|nr:hypothetical protein BVX94_03275 [bacterium B17]